VQSKEKLEIVASLSEAQTAKEPENKSARLSVRSFSEGGNHIL